MTTERIDDFRLDLLPVEDRFQIVASCPRLAGEAGPAELSAKACKYLLDVAERLERGHLIDLRAAAELGRKLFNLIFRDQIKELWDRSVDRLDERGHRLRLLIQLATVPALHELPWELLHDGRRFLAASAKTVVVRYLKQPRPVGSLNIRKKLRVLFTSACPEGMEALDVNREVELIRDGLKGLGDRAQLTVRHRISFEQLLNVISRADIGRRPFHIWHHCGHGRRNRGSGFELILENERQCEPVEVAELRENLKDLESLRAAVINVCHGARASGLAPALAGIGVPIVIGYRSKTFDRSASRFSASLYQFLCERPLDTAAQLARRDLAAEGEDPLEWAQLLLFSRTLDSTLLPADRPTVPPTPEAKSTPPTTIINFGGRQSADKVTQIGRVSRRRNSGSGALRIDFETETKDGAELLQIGELEEEP